MQKLKGRAENLVYGARRGQGLEVVRGHCERLELGSAAGQNSEPRGATYHGRTERGPRISFIAQVVCAGLRTVIDWVGDNLYTLGPSSENRVCLAQRRSDLLAGSAPRRAVKKYDDSGLLRELSGW